MTLTDDDLGARLRSALQEVTPLATDPVPPPRFAPGATAAGHRPPEAEVLDLHPPGPVARRPRRRLLTGGALLAAAAVAVGAFALTTDLGARNRVAPTGPAAGPAAPTGAPTGAPTADASGTLPPGVVPGLVVPWRCTAPAGVTIAASIDRDTVAAQVWRIGAGVSCAPYPDDVGRFEVDANGRGGTMNGEAPTTFGVAQGCVTAATASSPRFDVSFVSRGETDYLEFFGDGCRLLLPDR